MSINVSLHPHDSLKQPLKVNAEVQDLHINSALVQFAVGSARVDLYFESIEQIDLVLFHLENLSREAREAWSKNDDSEAKE